MWLLRSHGLKVVIGMLWATGRPESLSAGQGSAAGANTAVVAQKPAECLWEWWVG